MGPGSAMPSTLHIMPAARKPISDDLLIDLIPSRIDAIVASLDRRIGQQLDETRSRPHGQALSSTSGDWVAPQNATPGLATSAPAPVCGSIWRICPAVVSPITRALL